MTPAASSEAPLVDLDELSAAVDRCKNLSLILQLVMDGGSLSDCRQREGLCYDLAALIEEHARIADRLVKALL